MRACWLLCGQVQTGWLLRCKMRTGWLLRRQMQTHGLITPVSAQTGGVASSFGGAISFSASPVYEKHMDRSQAIDLLMESSERMFAEGIPLMRRLLPAESEIALWDHYPEYDVVNGPLACRYFYHCHPVEERGEAEHGHFHIFMGKSAFGRGKRALISPLTGKREKPKVVHIAALAIDPNGMPLSWFTTNRWVTGEWLYPAAAIAKLLAQFDLRGDNGDPLVNDWLTAMVQVSRGVITGLLDQRDQALASRQLDGDDRELEILSQAVIDLAALLD
jgi:hypothetical protein